MTHMTRTQAEALAAFVSRLRPEWRQAGIVANLEKAAPTADVYDVARALLNLAADQTVLTPGLLPGPGPHWTKPNGQRIERRGDLDVRCIDHPEQVMPCPTCKAADHMTPAEIAAAAALVKAEIAATRHDTATNKRQEAQQ